MLRLPILAVACAFLVAGCQQQPSLVGKWKTEGIKGTQIEFRSDRTVVFGINFRGMSMELAGKYSQEKNRVTISDWQSASNLPIPPGILNEAIGQEIVIQIAWKNADEILVSGNLILEGTYKREGT